MVRGGRCTATVNSATTMAPPATSEKVERAISTRASPTGQRRRSHSPAQLSAPAITSAVSSQVGTGADVSSCPPMTSSPKTTATRNSNVSTTQSRRLRRVGDAVAGAFILRAYRPGRPLRPPPRGPIPKSGRPILPSAATPAAPDPGQPGRTRRPIRRPLAGLQRVGVLSGYRLLAGVPRPSGGG